MWDLKLYLIYYFFLFDSIFINLFFYFCNLIDTTLQNGLILFNSKFYFEYAQNTTLLFGIKFLLCIFFLILIRGGTPRYRYDYLTKLGWLKFIGLNLIVFFIILLTIFVFF